MKTENVEPKPILHTEEELQLGIWEEKHDHVVRDYDYVVEIQNHPLANSEDRVSCIGITIWVKDSKIFKKIVLQQNPTLSLLRVVFDKPTGILRIHYDKSDINNIISILNINAPFKVVWGKFSLEEYKGKQFGSINFKSNL